MPSERFFLDAELQGKVSLQGTELHHLAHVMKVRIGEEIELVNGRGTLAIAKVAEISKREATLEVLSATEIPLKEPRLILAIPLMRPAKLELIIEKCTELGADVFWIYPAHHSEKGDLSEHQQERLMHIAISAMKQCGRLDLPKIEVIKHFEDIFKREFPVFFGDTRPKAPKIAPVEKMVFVTGPERGFSEKEVKVLEAKAKGVKLHENILRAETAPIAVAAIFSH